MSARLKWDKALMWTNRVFYIMLLALSALFFILYPHWFAWYLLVVLVLIAPFDCLISLPGILTRKLSLSLPYTLEQGEAGEVAVTVASGRLRLPSGPLKMRFRVKGPEREVSVRVRCTGETGAQAGFPIDTTHSGVVRCRLRRFIGIGVLGIVTAPVPVRWGGSVLILPRPVKPARAVSLPRAIKLLPKPGGGFSEDHDLRPYRIGDPVRTVHWKLSAKHDSLIVREPLSPPRHSRLIQTSPWSSVKEQDEIIGRFRWVSAYLLEQGLPHYVRFGEDSNIVEITRTEDIVECLYDILGGTPVDARKQVRAPGRFTWIYEINAVS